MLLMKYEEFSDYVCKCLVRIFEERGETVRVFKKRVTKNNGLELTALMVCRKNYAISPAIYVENYFQKYKATGNLDMVMEDIYKSFDDSMYESEVDTEAFCIFEEIKDKIIFRLVNRSRNEKMLKDIPYLPYLDLAITFRWVVYVDADGMSSVLVSNQDMERWNINIQYLFQLSMENTMRIFPLCIENLFTMLNKIYNIDEYENNGYKNLYDEKGQLFIITNNIGINGASAILYPGALESCLEKIGTDMYIMPSSVHEMLFISAAYVEDADTLKELVEEANHSVVHCTEVLSENIYFYDCKRKSLDIVH